MSDRNHTDPDDPEYLEPAIRAAMRHRKASQQEMEQSHTPFRYRSPLRLMLLFVVLVWTAWLSTGLIG